jgi:outer membrane usher protein FimD/PapC
VVSASNQSGTNYESWRVFDDTTYAWETGSGRYNTSTPYTHTADVTTMSRCEHPIGETGYSNRDFHTNFN